MGVIGVSLVLLLVLLGLCIPVGAALGVLGLSLDQIFSAMPLSKAMGEMAWSTSNEFLLVSIPLFVMLGEILLRAGFAARMYEAMAKWLSWLPGGLMHANIGASTVFAATSGSSVATAATVGTVALPQIKRFGYHEPLFLGSIAAGGTLGILIPPSINLVIYGVLTNTSVPKLYLAGILPGILAALAFMSVIIVACLWRPSWGGERVRASWSERFASLVHLLPPMFIFLLVVGSIYAGLATPTEAAALGVVGAFVLALIFGRVTRTMLREVAENTMRATAMIMLIVISAGFLNFVMSAIGLTDSINRAMTELGWSPGAMLLAMVVFYVILGCFMETLSMMITTIPIVAPIMFSLGYDPVWLGIVIIILVETALITPPVGLNLFVVQSLRKAGSIQAVVVGALPFVLGLFAVIALLAAWPDVALWLPRVFG